MQIYTYAPQADDFSLVLFFPLLSVRASLFRQPVQQLSAVNNADKSAAAAKQNSFPRRGGGQISNFMTPFGSNCGGACLLLSLFREHQFLTSLSPGLCAPVINTRCNTPSKKVLRLICKTLFLLFY